MPPPAAEPGAALAVAPEVPCEPLWRATARIVWPAVLAIVVLVAIAIASARIGDALQFGLASGSRVSKVQKTSAIHLLRHIETGDAAQLRLSVEALAPMREANAGRRALVAGDEAAFRRQMAAVGATPADAERRLFLYGIASRLEIFREILRKWEEVDRIIDEQRRIGEASVAMHATGLATPARKAQLVAQLLAADARHTAATNDMNVRILAAARWFRTGEMALTVGSAAGLLAFSLLVAANGVRRLTRARRAEAGQAEAVRQREQSVAALDLALNVTDVALWAYQPATGRVLYAHRWRTLLGYLDMPAELAAWDALVHEDDRALLADGRARHFAGETAYLECEFRMLHAAGHWVWVRSRGRVTRRGADGLPLEFHDAVMNIAEQAAARELERRQNEFLQAMLEGIDTGIMLSTRDRIRYVNTSLCRMLGHADKSRLIGASVTAFAASARHAEEITQRRRAALAGAELPLAVTEILGADGRPVKLIAAVSHLRWNDESHFVSTLTPLSEFERMEDKLKSARAKFERALIGHMEAQQAHIARELHDSIGSALAGLSLLVSIARNSPETAQVQSALDRCQQQIQSTVDTARQLARGIMPVATESGALYRALDQFVHDLQEGKQLDITLEAEQADLDAVAPDAANHVYRIVQEAVSNALRHGGARRIVVRAGWAEDAFHLVVEDDGAGLRGAAGAAEGIGLRSMRTRAHMLGGHLRVRGAPQGGMRVILTLPVAGTEPLR